MSSWNKTKKFITFSSLFSLTGKRKNVLFNWDHAPQLNRTSLDVCGEKPFRLDEFYINDVQPCKSRKNSCIPSSFSTIESERIHEGYPDVFLSHDSKRYRELASSRNIGPFSPTNAQESPLYFREYSLLDLAILGNEEQLSPYIHPEKQTLLVPITDGVKSDEKTQRSEKGFVQRLLGHHSNWIEEQVDHQTSSPFILKDITRRDSPLERAKKSIALSHIARIAIDSANILHQTKHDSLDEYAAILRKKRDGHRFEKVMIYRSVDALFRVNQTAIPAFAFLGHSHEENTHNRLQLNLIRHQQAIARRLRFRSHKAIFFSRFNPRFESLANQESFRVIAKAKGMKIGCWIETVYSPALMKFYATLSDIDQTSLQSMTSQHIQDTSDMVFFSMFSDVSDSLDEALEKGKSFAQEYKQFLEFIGSDAKENRKKQAGHFQSQSEMVRQQQKKWNEELSNLDVHDLPYRDDIQDMAKKADLSPIEWVRSIYIPAYTSLMEGLCKRKCMIENTPIQCLSFQPLFLAQEIRRKMMLSSSTWQEEASLAYAEYSLIVRDTQAPTGIFPARSQDIFYSDMIRSIAKTANLTPAQWMAKVYIPAFSSFLADMHAQGIYPAAHTQNLDISIDHDGDLHFILRDHVDMMISGIDRLLHNEHEPFNSRFLNEYAKGDTTPFDYSIANTCSSEWRDDPRMFQPWIHLNRYALQSVFHVWGLPNQPMLAKSFLTHYRKRMQKNLRERGIEACLHARWTRSLLQFEPDLPPGFRINDSLSSFSPFVRAEPIIQSLIQYFVHNPLSPKSLVTKGVGSMIRQAQSEKMNYFLKSEAFQEAQKKAALDPELQQDLALAFKHALQNGLVEVPHSFRISSLKMHLGIECSQEDHLQGNLIEVIGKEIRKEHLKRNHLYRSFKENVRKKSGKETLVYVPFKDGILAIDHAKPRNIRLLGLAFLDPSSLSRHQL